MVTHRAQQLEDLRLAERQRGSPRREAVANLPGSPSLERVVSKIEVIPVKACQVARLPGSHNRIFTTGGRTCVRHL